MVCAHGHIDDFPYFNWVHAGSMRTGEKIHDMKIEARGTTASLRDIVISCSCGANRDDGQARSHRDALHGVFTAPDDRPWLARRKRVRVRLVRVRSSAARRTSGSAATAPSLSIPPWSEGAFRLLDRHWDPLRHCPGRRLAAGRGGDCASPRHLVQPPTTWSTPVTPAQASPGG